jgi:hypothetical protein
LNKIDSFKVEEVCAIIKMCATSGVHSLEYNGLKLVMGIPHMTVQTTEPVVLPPEIIKEAETQTRAANAKEEFTKQQARLDQLLIDDPEEFFEAIKNGDLTDEEKS